MARTVKVLSIRGIPINIHVSWLAIHALITLALRGLDQRGAPATPEPASPPLRRAA